MTTAPLPKTTRAKREFTRFVKFCVVGSIGAVVDFGVFNLLNTVLGVWYLLSGSLSFMAGVTSNFIWNRYWTYPDSRSKPVSRQVIQFVLVNAAGLLLRAPILAVTEKPMIGLAERVLNPSSPFTELLSRVGIVGNEVVLGRNMALVIAVAVVLFWNFGVNRFWTYSDAP
jgi:putative flippase GtrA